MKDYTYLKKSEAYGKIISFFTSLSPDISDYPILYPTLRRNYWISVEGEVCKPSNEELHEMLAVNNPPLICYCCWT